MDYEINVARYETRLDGVERAYHYFRVKVDYYSLKAVYNDLKERFPECELTVYQVENVSYNITDEMN